jgi:hypothetical protein
MDRAPGIDHDASSAAKLLVGKQYDGWCAGAIRTGEWFQRLMKII